MARNTNVQVRPYTPADALAVEDIFWLTSAKTDFPNITEKANFFAHYCGNYLAHSLTFKIVCVVNNIVRGYLILSTDTLRDPFNQWPQVNPQVMAFWEQYPAHLHINVHPESQGMGLGQALMDTALTHLRVKHIKGLHVLTAEGHRNNRFYERCGFKPVPQDQLPLSSKVRLYGHKI
jgi:GNAT superfamily N-acetyltransferase